MEGRVLGGRYEIGRLLGAGGMAEVYEALDQVLDRRVAVKVLSGRYATDPSFLERFRREARAAASMSHPNIVNIFDTGIDDGVNYIVMELVPGRTLRDRLRDGPLGHEEVASVGIGICAALAAAHEAQLVHRDIKPGNIMLTPAGQVKVMDFGIVRAFAAEPLTYSAHVIGTAQYLSPEQAQGEQVDGRADLYGLGCCVYEMLTGRVPFTGESPLVVATAVTLATDLLGGASPPTSTTRPLALASPGVVGAGLSDETTSSRDPGSSASTRDKSSTTKRTTTTRRPTSTLGPTSTTRRVTTTTRRPTTTTRRPTTTTKPKVTVPGVVGLSCPQAKSALLNAGLRVAQHLVADEDPGNHGVVLSQSPGGGARVTKGSTVTITLGSFEPDPPASC